MWGAALGVIKSLGGEWLASRRRVKEAKTEAKIEVIKNTSDQSGWKDEYLVVLWSIPAIMCFMPGMQGYVRDGFHILATVTPEWYPIGLLGITGAVFGLKRLKRWNAKE